VLASVFLLEGIEKFGFAERSLYYPDTMRKLGMAARFLIFLPVAVVLLSAYFLLVLRSILPTSWEQEGNAVSRWLNTGWRWVKGKINTHDLLN
jgi:hypothetical protein